MLLLTAAGWLWPRIEIISKLLLKDKIIFKWKLSNFRLKTENVVSEVETFHGFCGVIFHEFRRSKKFKFHKQFHIVWESGPRVKSSQWIDPLRLLFSTLGLFNGKIKLCRLAPPGHSGPGWPGAEAFVFSTWKIGLVNELAWARVSHHHQPATNLEINK